MAIVYDKWQTSELDPDSLACASGLAQNIGVSGILAKLIVSRGYRADTEARTFLYPSLSMLPSPWLMKGMSEAVKLICDARSEGKKIVVFGDYDVDGVTSTALLVHFFREIDIDVSYVHPDRLQDGYGLSENMVNWIADTHPNSLLITVDCGISDDKSIKIAKGHGLSVIVTDHHVPPETIPDADAVINPLQDTCEFPYKYLAGVGVSFYLIIGIRSKLREKGTWKNDVPPNLKDHLDLVAIGSVADMVPLSGVNRILVRAGLDLLDQSYNHRKGLVSLLSVSGLYGKELCSEDIGYHIGPRINAAGRIGSAKLATDLLVCDDTDLAYKMGEELDSINESRKKMVESLVELVIKEAEYQVEKDRAILVLHGEDWHHGLIGIAASRVCETYRRPTIILGGNLVAKGSARSVPEVDIHKLFGQCSEHLIQYGGHKQAAGLTMHVDNIEAFSNAANEAIRDLKLKQKERSLVIDGLLDAEESESCFFDNYKLLMPFGVANHEPKFSLTKPCYLRNPQVIGKKKNHLRFSVKVYRKWINGIGFGFGHLAESLECNKAKIAFSIRDNWFKGRKSIQVFLHDIEIVTD